MVSSIHPEPVSRTDQYKRVMKPLLERKRRARINRCLDELRDLLVAAMQAEGETVTRLEKADILELTVRHVRRLNQRRRLTIPPAGAVVHDPRQDAVKFQQGFLAAAQQVQSFLMSAPTLVEPSASSRLLVHLSSCASAITNTAEKPIQNSHPVISPPTSTSSSPSLVLSGKVLHTSKIQTPTSSPAEETLPTSILMDLSMKPAPSSAHPPQQQHRIVAPTPIRKEPVIVLKDPSAVLAPQDLSIRKESKNAWRPW
ncbi:Transcription factor HES-2 [Armadillidium nasatum]|uniref:Transcription factor HES-2 n=1 Tax=Armadillidium nasatum TaxID=96803 RepID=A0A5N5TBJ1_9CRUS|nr:Transcription factor HES-2 [Armadillidium nasatum]